MKVEIEFVSDIVGHNVETIKQMYEDWIRSPQNNQLRFINKTKRTNHYKLKDIKISIPKRRLK